MTTPLELISADLLRTVSGGDYAGVDIVDSDAWHQYEKGSLFGFVHSPSDGWRHPMKSGEYAHELAKRRHDEFVASVMRGGLIGSIGQ